MSNENPAVDGSLPEPHLPNDAAHTPVLPAPGQASRPHEQLSPPEHIGGPPHAASLQHGAAAQHVGSPLQGAQQPSPDAVQQVAHQSPGADHFAPNHAHPVVGHAGQQSGSAQVGAAPQHAFDASSAPQHGAAQHGAPHLQGPSGRGPLSRLRVLRHARPRLHMAIVGGTAAAAVAVGAVAVASVQKDPSPRKTVVVATTTVATVAVFPTTTLAVAAANVPIPTPTTVAAPATTTVAPGGATVAASADPWAANAVGYGGENGTKVKYVCPPNGTLHAVWGTDTYTDDSSVCSAAVQLSLITVASGGEVEVQISPGLAAYAGGVANGVNSLSYGNWGGSFTFPSVPAGSVGFEVPPESWGTSAAEYRGQNEKRFALQCAKNGAIGSVWGTATYTDDSSICTAAVEAGIITVAGGGEVVYEIAPGASTYTGSTKNGVTTNDYGSFDGSFTLPADQKLK